MVAAAREVADPASYLILGQYISINFVQVYKHGYIWCPTQSLQLRYQAVSLVHIADIPTIL